MYNRQTKCRWGPFAAREQIVGAPPDLQAVPGSSRPRCVSFDPASDVLFPRPPKEFFHPLHNLPIRLKTNFRLQKNLFSLESSLEEAKKAEPAT